MTTYRKFNDGVDELAPGVKIRWYDDTFKTLRPAEIVREADNGWCWWVNEGRGDIMIAYIKIKEIEGVPRNILVSTEEIKEVEDMGSNRREGAPKTTTITPEMVVAAYIATRDAISALTKKYEEEKAALEAIQAKRGGWLLGTLDRQQAKSMKCDAGTFFVDWKDSATVADGPAFMAWVHEKWEDRKHFLENRVSKTAVKARIEDEKETPPPGVNYTKIKDVKVRRA